LDDVPVFNGLTATAVSVNPSRMRMVVQIDGEDTQAEVKYWPPQFGAEETVDRRVLPKDSKFTLWDWAYAITAHKSQGSQWRTVAVYDETHPEWDTKRWRYTAATRASERLIWITP
jgi:exodeoxyribonuclease-5